MYVIFSGRVYELLEDSFLQWPVAFKRLGLIMYVIFSGHVYELLEDSFLQLPGAFKRPGS